MYNLLGRYTSKIFPYFSKSWRISSGLHTQVDQRGNMRLNNKTTQACSMYHHHVEHTMSTELRTWCPAVSFSQAKRRHLRVGHLPDGPGNGFCSRYALYQTCCVNSNIQGVQNCTNLCANATFVQELSTLTTFDAVLRLIKQV